MRHFAFCKNNLFLTFLFITLLATSGAKAQLPKGTWFVQAGARGDGSSAENPLGTAIKVEQVTSPGDIILLLASDNPLKGGLALKPGQTLMGLPNSGSFPVITNMDSTRHGGVGIMLADSVRIVNVHVEETFRSGIYGKDVSVQIAGVTVRGANRGKKLLELKRSLDPFWAPTHGGMVFVQTSGESYVDVSQSKVLDAAGHNILAINYGTAQSRLSLRHCRVHGGSPMRPFDVALYLMVTDPTAKAWLEIKDSEFGGRMSPSGRNIMVEAAGGAYANARILRSRVGATGQDGVLATSMQSPSEVEMYIEDCRIEEAGQMNLEGTILNFPPRGDMPVNEGKVSITVENSMILSATELNIWLGPSSLGAVGTYELTISDSRIEDALFAGLAISNLGITDEGKYRVKLRNNTISGNGQFEIAVGAPDTQIDARGNCWGQPKGLDLKRVLLSEPDVIQLNVSEPLDCREDE